MTALPEWFKLLKGDMNDDDGEVVMMLHQPVGYNPATGEGMSSRVFGQVLNSIPKNKKVTLDINSLGGKVDDGIAMHNMVLARGGITTRVIGYAASMGAVIHQAGAKRVMMPGTMLVVHNPQASVDGDHRDLAKGSEFLKQVKDSLCNLLASRTGQKPAKVSQMMDEVTAMDADDAKKLGFCDEIGAGSPAFNEMKPIALFNFLRDVKNAVKEAPTTEQPSTQSTNKPSMKLIIAALGKLVKLQDTTTDELAAPQVETAVTALIAERDTLKTENASFKDAQKARVTNRVDLAITNKLVKAERKDALIATGLRDEAELDNCIADLAEVRGAQATNPARRAALPVPAAKGSSDADVQIAKLQEDLREATPAGRVVISRQLRDLRGHKNLFEAPASK